MVDVRPDWAAQLPNSVTGLCQSPRLKGALQAKVCKLSKLQTDCNSDVPSVNFTLWSMLCIFKLKICQESEAGLWLFLSLTHAKFANLLNQNNFQTTRMQMAVIQVQTSSTKSSKSLNDLQLLSNNSATLKHNDSSNSSNSSEMF